jgi:TonB family protein
MTMKGIPIISVLLSLFLNGAVLLVLAQSLSQGSGGYVVPARQSVKIGRSFMVFAADTNHTAESDETIPALNTAPSTDAWNPSAVTVGAVYASTADGAAGDLMEAETSGSMTEETLRQRISALIHQRMRYPPAARRRGIEGTVKLILGIGSDGELWGLRLQESSGSSLLDNAAMELSREIFPLRGMRIPSSTELALSIRYMLQDERL